MCAEDITEKLNLITSVCDLIFYVPIQVNKRSSVVAVMQSYRGSEVHEMKELLQYHNHQVKVGVGQHAADLSLTFLQENERNETSSLKKENTMLTKYLSLICCG